MRRRGAGIVAVLALLAAACGGTETGNPGSASVALAVRASDPSRVAVGPIGTGTTVEAAFVSLARAELVPCVAGAAPVVVVEGPAVIDLVAGSEEFPIAPGVYCGMRIVLGRQDLPGGPDVPSAAQASVAIHGVRADGAPFTAESADARTIVAEGAAFSIANGAHVIFAFDVSRWLDGLLDGAPVVDGRVTIDGGGALGAEFDRQTSGDLFEDTSADGIIDPGEATPVASTLPGSAPPS